MAVPFLGDIVGLLAGSMFRLIVFELVLFFISALFIWIGAKVADVEKGSIIRAFLIAVIVAILTPLLLLPFAGFELFSMALGIIINLAIIKLVFSTGWRKALVTWIFSLIAGFLSVLILSFVLILLI
jgi:hypothetical protein